MLKSVMTKLSFNVKLTGKNTKFGDQSWKAKLLSRVHKHLLITNPELHITFIKIYFRQKLSPWTLHPGQSEQGKKLGNEKIE